MNTSLDGVLQLFLGLHCSHKFAVASLSSSAVGLKVCKKKCGDEACLNQDYCPNTFHETFAAGWKQRHLRMV